jgi:hypothetical protein
MTKECDLTSTDERDGALRLPSWVRRSVLNTEENRAVRQILK